MKLISVNRGQVQPLANAKTHGVTGIYKQPLTTSVTITQLGIPDDAICDVENHGGVDQAIYIYGQPDYAWWEAELGRPMTPGIFGENLTVADLESANVAIGDRLHIGTCVLEVTAPRVPCVTLARRMDDNNFVKKFKDAERPGLYCRVIQEGEIQQGDDVRYEPYAGERVTINELFRTFYDGGGDEATIRRHLAAPIAIRARKDKERQLAKLVA